MSISDDKRLTLQRLRVCLVKGPSKPVREYSMHETYSVGDNLRHHIFESGRVLTVVNNKIEVLFFGSPEGSFRKWLIQGVARPNDVLVKGVR